jgi:hypothetical protein
VSLAACNPRAAWTGIPGGLSFPGVGTIGDYTCVLANLSDEAFGELKAAEFIGQHEGLIRIMVGKLSESGRDAKQRRTTCAKPTLHQHQSLPLNDVTPSALQMQRNCGRL